MLAKLCIFDLIEEIALFPKSFILPKMFVNTLPIFAGSPLKTLVMFVNMLETVLDKLDLMLLQALFTPDETLLQRSLKKFTIGEKISIIAEMSEDTRFVRKSQMPFQADFTLLVMLFHRSTKNAFTAFQAFEVESVIIFHNSEKKSTKPLSGSVIASNIYGIISTNCGRVCKRPSTMASII